jgi:hypothetical protein
MSEETKGYTLPRGVGGVTGPIIPGTEATPDSADQATQWVVDLLSGDLNNKKPLGEGFQSKYQMEQTYMDKAKGFPVTRTVDVDAEEYLKDKGYNFIYFPYMPGEVARDIAPALRIILKNQMVDEEFVKGITRLMEFSMNNGGKFDWVQSLGILRTDMSVRKAATTKAPKIENEQLDDLVDDLLAKSKSRKGAPLSQEEKEYITQKIGARIGLFNQEIAGLAGGTPGRIAFDPSTPVGGTMIPGTPAEQPDTEQLEEDLAGIEEEVFAPREEAARQQQEFEADRSRGAATVADLASLMGRPVQR